MEQTGWQLKYPIDMDGQHFFPEAIKFTFNKRLGVNFQKALGNLESSSFRAGGKVKGFTNAQASAVLKMFGNKSVLPLTPSQVKIMNAELQKNHKELFSQQTMSDSMKEDMEQSTILNALEKISKVQESIQRQNSQLENIGTVYLNMPNNIALSEDIGWGGESLGVVGAITKGALKGGTDTTNALLGAGAGAAGNILSAAAGGLAGRILSKIPGVSGWTGGFLGAIAGETIQRGGEAAFSVKQNPYMEMMFSGIGFRSFKFDFVFRARNKSEINMVGKIIQMFRQHSRPSWQGGALGKSFMKYPQEYKIQFLTDIKGAYKDNLHLPTLKPCVCSNVETNFTPDNVWSAFENGAPVSITLGLTFQEKELVMADDVMKEWPDQTEPEGRSENFGSEEFSAFAVRKQQGSE